MNRQGLYLYCLAFADRLAAVAGTGVDGESPVVLRRFQDLVAVLSMVPLEEFSGEAAERNLADISWVGPRACRHGEVVGNAARCSPVLPLRFGTIFSSPRALERFLGSHQRPIREFLEWVTDQEEWSVKGALDRPKAREAILALRLPDEKERLAALPAGRRYLEEQRLQGRAEGALNGWLRQVCQTVATDLGRCATDVCQRRPLPQDRGTEMVLNLAFLVHRARGAEFSARIERANAELAPRGLGLQLSGPWPPYSFTPALVATGEEGPGASPQ